MKDFIELHVDDCEQRRKLVNINNISYIIELFLGGCMVEVNSGLSIEAKENYDEVIKKIKEAQDA